MAKLTPIDKPILKNQLHLTVKEAHTDANDHDQWTSPTTYVPYCVETKEDVDIFMRCLEISIGRIADSRQGYGDTYSSVEFDEFEDEFDSIEVDGSDQVIIFVKNNKEYIIDFNYDLSMPTEDGRYFAGLQFVSAVFYDENGDKFNVEF